MIYFGIDYVNVYIYVYFLTFFADISTFYLDSKYNKLVVLYWPLVFDVLRISYLHSRKGAEARQG